MARRYLIIPFVLAALIGCAPEEPESQSNSNTDCSIDSAEANVRAEELVGTWATNGCVVLANGSVDAITGATGSSGSTSGGEGTRTEFTFNSDGTGEGIKIYYSESNCNPSAQSRSYGFCFNYYVGDEITTISGETVMELDLLDDDGSVFTIFSVTDGGTRLKLGSHTFSTEGQDGTQEQLRLDSLGGNSDADSTYIPLVQ